MLRRLCVYCGSSLGARARYAESAAALGRLVAARGIGLVYGAGNLGLMGTAADAALAAGGEVVGVIPRALVDLELAHQRLTDLRIVDSMHQRKAMMAELSDGFLALPGGIGTLEELGEILTWRQLEIHTKPIGLLDVDGYWRDLLRFLDHAVSEGFVRQAHRDALLVDDDPARLLDRLAAEADAADAPRG
jgi:uncharacterized protein (TIGR00730 family)